MFQNIFDIFYLHLGYSNVPLYGQKQNHRQNGRCLKENQSLSLLLNLQQIPHILQSNRFQARNESLSEMGIL